MQSGTEIRELRAKGSRSSWQNNPQAPAPYAAMVVPGARIERRWPQLSGLPDAVGGFSQAMSRPNLTQAPVRRDQCSASDVVRGTAAGRASVLGTWVASQGHIGSVG